MKTTLEVLQLARKSIENQIAVFNNPPSCAFASPTKSWLDEKEAIEAAIAREARPFGIFK